MTLVPQRIALRVTSEEVVIIPKSLAVLLGSFLLAIGINVFLVPHKLLDGGFIGIALLFNYILHLNVGWVTFICSAPVYLYALLRHRPYFYNSIFGLVSSSLLIDFFRDGQKWIGFSVELDPLLCSIVGGIFVGAGSGLMLRHKTSTEGADLLALFLSDFFSLNVGFVIFFLDFLIICFGTLVLPDIPLLLSTIMIITVSIVTSLFTHAAPVSRPTTWIRLARWSRGKK